MIFGVGIDIIEVSRIEKQLSRGDDRFQRRLFTDREIAYCERKKFKGLHYAARFAAKEAFLKALGTGLGGGLSWKDVEIVNNEAGKPTLRLDGKARLLVEGLGLTGLHVSLTHVKDTAVAVVIIEK